MMVAQQVGPLWTVEQYLELEHHSAIKHEFHGGYVYAVAGGSPAHSQIAGNVYAFLRAGVRGTGCRALNSDIKIRQSTGDFVYADAVVTCDRRDDAPGQDWIDYPVLVVEVLSPSTEHHDRTDKFEGYKAVSTLCEYVLVDYRRHAVEVWLRGEGGSWSSRHYGPGEDVHFQNLGFSLPMDLIYEDSGVGN